jgi:hypothetical protein
LGEALGEHSGLMLEAPERGCSSMVERQLPKLHT